MTLVKLGCEPPYPSWGKGDTQVLNGYPRPCGAEAVNNTIEGQLSLFKAKKKVTGRAVSS